MILKIIYFFVISLSAQAQEPVAEPAPAVTEAPAAATAETPPPVPTSGAQGEESNIMRLIQPFIYSKDTYTRDPFQLPESSPVPLVQGELFGPFLELQNITLDEVTVKGLILSPTEPKALIAFKNYRGKEEIVRVGVGFFVGENFGRIQAIRDGKVIIVQTLDQNGKIRTTTRVLTVRK